MGNKEWFKNKSHEMIQMDGVLCLVLFVNELYTSTHRWIGQNDWYVKS